MDCLIIKEKAKVRHVTVVVSDQPRIRASPNQKENQKEHTKQEQTMKKPIMEKEKARPGKGKGPKGGKGAFSPKGHMPAGESASLHKGKRK